MRLHDILAALDQLAPLHLAEEWDQVGLHLGDLRQDVRRMMLCIDLTAAVLAEAKASRCELLIAYHPPIFHPLPRLTNADPWQRLILYAAQAGLALYSPHTALDAAPGGLNDWLAQGLDAADVQPLRRNPPLAARSSPRCKLVTFIPPAHVDRLRSALAAAGAGHVGDYAHCSFSIPGQGTFKGGLSTRPAIGKAGRLERVSELRMEMVCPTSLVDQVVAALRQAHPYEEPAFDIYPLLPVADGKDQPAAGQGRVVDLRQPMTLAELGQRFCRRLGTAHVEIAVAVSNRRQKIRRVGLCAGAGGSLLEQAGDIEVFFTGEMRHHDVLTALARGVSVILAGHTQTERPYLPTYRRRIAGLLESAVNIRISRRDRPPGRIAMRRCGKTHAAVPKPRL